LAFNPLTLTVAIWVPERQSVRMSKLTNDGLTRSGTGCFIAVPIWQQWALKGYMISNIFSQPVKMITKYLCNITGLSRICYLLTYLLTKPTLLCVDYHTEDFASV